jgi:hypothetical protein
MASCSAAVASSSRGKRSPDINRRKALTLIAFGQHKPRTALVKFEDDPIVGCVPRQFTMKLRLTGRRDVEAGFIDPEDHLLTPVSPAAVCEERGRDSAHS